jgi:hypothetical protein
MLHFVFMGRRSAASEERLSESRSVFSIYGNLLRRDVKILFNFHSSFVAFTPTVSTRLDWTPVT